MPPPEARSRLARLKVAAHRLRLAYTNGTIEPLRDLLAPYDVEGAYLVQDINSRRWCAAGRRIAGYKIGLTAAALQQRLGIDEPDFGILFDDMRVADGGVLPSGAVQQPRVEGEIALVLGHDILNPRPTGAEVRNAVSAALPAIEIVGSRIADWAITAADTIADNASAGAFVTGKKASLSPLTSLAEARMTLRIDGDIVGEGLGSAALGDPLDALAWLARKAAARGHPLRAGEVVLTGSLAPMVPLPAGAMVEVEVTGLGKARFRSDG